MSGGETRRRKTLKLNLRPLALGQEVAAEEMFR